MVATGVPQYVKVLTELKEIKETVLATRSEIFAHVTARFDAIEKHIDGIGPSVADSLAENYKIDGHTPMTKVSQTSLPSPPPPSIKREIMCLYMFGLIVICFHFHRRVCGICFQNSNPT